VRGALHAAENELAAAVTSSHAAGLLRGTAEPTRTNDEQISQTGRQTEETVLIPISAKCLKSLVVCAVICEPVSLGFRLRTGIFLQNSANNRLLAG
jgi:hypothetical protein